jgi:hypothetical protein
MRNAFTLESLRTFGLWAAFIALALRVRNYRHRRSVLEVRRRVWQDQMLEYDAEKETKPPGFESAHLVIVTSTAWFYSSAR